MFHTRTSRFKVETSWQELVNRRIQKIEIDLKEITLFNRAGFLLAKGAFRREVIYNEFDGRFRRVEDRVQFEVVVGEELPEPFPMLKSELKQDYYIFQPRQIGDNQAVLEQGFSLTVLEVEAEAPPERSETIIADCIVNRGSSGQLVQVRLGLKERFLHYQDFQGTIEFEPVSRNLISGKIQGILEYSAADHCLKTQVIEEKVSWLWNDIPIEEEGMQYIINGTVNGSPVLINTNGIWQLELKIDYSWILIKRKDLPCVLASHVEVLPSLGHKVKTEVLLEERELRLAKSYDFLADGMIPAEVNVTVMERNDRFGKKGLLLESLLKIEAYGRSADGLEIYRQWEAAYSELIEGYDYFKQNEWIRLDAKLQIRDIRFEVTGCSIKVNLVLHYQLRIYQSKVINGIEDPKNGVLVLIPELVDLKNFSVMKETMFHLRRKPLKIDGIQANVMHLNPCVKQGRFQVAGDLEVTVGYCHASGKSYQEVYTVPFLESFLWEKTGADWDIMLNAVIEFDTYQLNGMNVLYKYLLHFDVSFYRKSELMLKILQPAEIQTSQALNLVKGPELPSPVLGEEIQLIVEQEMPLQFGTPREISRKKSYISSFDYRDAANALLAEGVFETDLEYWDQDGFLRKERLDMPFWKFVPYSSNQFQELSRLQLFPEILHTSVIPVNAWPWQKGTVKISVEIVLKRGKGEERE